MAPEKLIIAYDRAIDAGQQLFFVIVPILLLSTIFPAISYLICRRNTNARDIFVLTFMFSLFGAVVGAFCGASETPIVSTIVPAIISLISGYIIYLTSKDLSDAEKK